MFSENITILKDYWYITDRGLLILNIDQGENYFCTEA